MRRIVEKVYSRLIGFDPGLVRLEKAGVSILSFLSAWIIMRQILQTWAPQLATPLYLKLVLFAPILSLLCSILINDLRSIDRRNNLLLSLLPVAVVLTSFTLLPVISWLYGIILLILFFFSYYFRRYGVRFTELFFIACATFYFATLLNINLAALPWFLVATLTGIFSVYLWRFILIPYSPERQLRRTILTYYRQAAQIVSEIIRTLQKKPSFDTTGLEMRLRRIYHSRKVIESEIEALSPPVWTQEQLNRLRIDFYNSEQGLNLMAQSLPHLITDSDQIPANLSQALFKSLADFQQVLIKAASPESVENLEKQLAVLRNTVNNSNSGSSAGPWTLSLLRLLAGGAQLNSAIKDVRQMEKDRKDLASRPVPLPNVSNNPKQPEPKPAASGPARLRRISLQTLHLTTILGLQASLAALLAMLVAYFLSLDHSNWVFWTTFTVIAGSTGESLRRMSFRVIGTITGVVAGILVSLLLVRLNGGSLPTVAFVAVFIFLAAYFVDTSYVWMILWINMATALLFIGLGGTMSDILVNRPINTFIGAAIAALIVVYVLPVRTRDRFKRSLASFMNILDRYIAGYTGRLTGRTSANFEATVLQVNTAFDRLEQAYPSLALEYNPLARAQNPFLQLSITLQSLKADLLHMSQDLNLGVIPTVADETAGLINAIQEHIHRNIEAIINLISQKPAAEVSLLTDLFARANRLSLLEQALNSKVGDQQVSETQVLIYLARVNQVLYQVASTFSAVRT